MNKNSLRQFLVGIFFSKIVGSVPAAAQCSPGISKKTAFVSRKTIYKYRQQQQPQYLTMSVFLNQTLMIQAQNILGSSTIEPHLGVKNLHSCCRHQQEDSLCQSEDYIQIIELKSESNLKRTTVCNTEQPQLRQLGGAACRERIGGVMAAAGRRTETALLTTTSQRQRSLYPSVSIEENTQKIHLFSVLLHILLLACSERRMTMNPTHFLVYPRTIFSCWTVHQHIFV